MQHDLSLKCDLRDIINILFFAIFICISTETLHIVLPNQFVVDSRCCSGPRHVQDCIGDSKPLSWQSH